MSSFNCNEGKQNFDNNVKSTMLEIFKILIVQKKMKCIKHTGFCFNLLQPKDLLHYQLTFSKLLIDQVGNNINAISPTAIIGTKCEFHNAVIGHNCVIGDLVKLSNCIILPNTIIKDATIIKDSIIGWKCTIGSWVHISKNCVFSEDVSISDGTVIMSTFVLPFKNVNMDSISCKEHSVLM